MAITSIVTVILLVVTACTGGGNHPNPSDSASTSASSTASPGTLPDTFPLPAGRTADADVLPKGVTPDDPATADQVIGKVQTLLATARSDESHRLAGILQLMHAAGIAVADADQDNKTLQTSAAPTIGTVDVTQIEGLSASADSPTQTSVKAVLDAISSSAGLPQIPPQGFIDALRQDLAAADGSSDLTRRFWAELIYAAGPDGAQLRPSSAASPSDLSLAPLQAMLIFNQLTGEAAQKLKTGSSASAHAFAHSNVQLVEGGGSNGCSPQQEAEKLTTEIFKTGYGVVVDKVLEYTLEIAGPTVATIAALVEAMMPLISTLAAKEWVRVDISQAADPVARTRSATDDGDRTSIYAHFHFEVPGGSALACVALYLFLISLGKFDPSVPPNGDIGEMPITWNLHDTGITTDEPHGFLVYPEDQQGKILHDATDASGNATIDVEGYRQAHQKPDSSGPYIRNAKMSVQYDPSASTKASAASAFSKGVATAIAALAAPPSVVVKFGVEILISIGLFTATKNINVKDWTTWPTEVDVSFDGGQTNYNAGGWTTHGSGQATYRQQPSPGVCGASDDVCSYGVTSASGSFENNEPPPLGGPTVPFQKSGGIVNLCIPGGFCAQRWGQSTMYFMFQGQAGNLDAFDLEYSSLMWTFGVTQISDQIPGTLPNRGADTSYGKISFQFKY